MIWPDGRMQGDLGGSSLKQSVLDSALGLLSDQKTARRSFEIEGETCDLFIEVFPPPPRLIIVGAVHIAIPLVESTEKRALTAKNAESAKKTIGFRREKCAEALPFSSVFRPLVSSSTFFQVSPG